MYLSTGVVKIQIYLLSNFYNDFFILFFCYEFALAVSYHDYSENQLTIHHIL